MVENLLSTLSSGDSYELFAKDFDLRMKSAIPESKYKEICRESKTHFGDYVSKELAAHEVGIVGNNFITLIYKANFSLEQSPLWVKVVFTPENAESKVVGFWIWKPNK